MTTPLFRRARLASIAVSCSATVNAAVTDTSEFITTEYSLGYHLIGSPFSAASPENNTLVADVFGEKVPTGTTLQTYNTGSHITYTFDGTDWRDDSSNVVTAFAPARERGAILHLPTESSVYF